MGDWYTIGLALGIGLAVGVLLAGALSATPLGRIAAVVLGGAAGAAAGLLIEDWSEVAAGLPARAAGRRASAHSPSE